jgi:lipopolysaccharide/colanic/teichoic acid biosynthesis glycosyltransferase
MSRATYGYPGQATGRSAVTPVTVSDHPPDARAPVRRRMSRRRLLIGDGASALLAVAASLLVYPGQSHGTTPATSAVAVVTLPAAWVVVLLLARCYDRRGLGDGTQEFTRVVLGAVLLLGGVAVLSWGWQLDIPRAFVAMALPLATALTLAQRHAQRRWLHRAHAKGQHLRRILLVGHREGVAALHQQLRREPGLGYRAIGCCLPGTDGAPGVFNGLRVLGGLDDVVDAVRRFEVDTVAAIPSAVLDGEALRRLGWELEETGADLLLAPAITETGGPRVSVHRLGGMSLLQLERPELLGARRLVKFAFDGVCAVVFLFLLAPVLVTIAILIKCSSAGPVLVGEERVGRDERIFRLLRFRTTATGVGSLLRRYSLDELPQMLNVLRGDMSLVGPRPPRPAEVEHLGVDRRRSLAVRPGLTGVWPSGGWSGLSRDESARLDIEYVENWSLRLDLTIIRRTFASALRGRQRSI